MFHPSASPQLVSEIKPPKPDPRAAKVSKVHAEIMGKVKDGTIYERQLPPGSREARIHRLHGQLVKQARARAR